MKYKIQDIKLPAKPAGFAAPKKISEKRIVKVESREARDYSWGMWLLAGISVVFLVFSLSLVFSRAKITVEAKKMDLPIDAAFNLTKTDGLIFEIATASGEETKIVTSETTVDFQRKATGQVLLYNTTNQDQKLLIETRLLTEDGKIFKTDKAVIMPKGSADKPGSVKVGVTAEKAGEEYNVGLVDFKIFGFKGSAKYDKFYGRASLPLAGGLIGKRYTLTATEAEKLLIELKEALREKLIKQISLQTPSDYFVLPDIVFVDTTTASFESETPEISVKATGQVYAVILNEKNLSKELAKKTNIELADAPVSIANLKDLVFALENKEGLKNGSGEVSFSVKGDGNIVWVVDAASLKERLVGSRRKDFTAILADFPAIEKAELRVLPFWKRTLPASVKHIKVTVK